MIQGRMPKLVEALRCYNLQTFTSDLIAGLTVGLVALPLAMAFAISSGVTPQAGLYGAVITGFLISALGGSKTQIGGPTWAFVVVLNPRIWPARPPETIAAYRVLPSGDIESPSEMKLTKGVFVFAIGSTS